MSVFRRLFGGATEPDPSLDPAPDAARDAAPTADTATVRRIVSQLEALPPERARYLAAASYVLARVANADLVMSPEETAFMERTLVEESGIGEAEAVLVVEAAKQQARLFGSTEDYLVTREFKRISEPDQRLRLLRACFLAAAADSSISSAEDDGYWKPTVLPRETASCSRASCLPAFCASSSGASATGKWSNSPRNGSGCPWAIAVSANRRGRA